MHEQDQPPRVTSRDLLSIFLKAGLAFGGGLGILAVLEDELVNRRRLVSRADFLALYSIGRIVPSGTLTALAVAFGHRFGGLPGTVFALMAMVLPAFVMTVALASLFVYLRDSPLLGLLPVTILPAALAFIVAAALRLGRGLFKVSIELVLAASAFAASLFLDLSPALLLIAGGLAGTALLSRREERGT